MEAPAQSKLARPPLAVEAAPVSLGEAARLEFQASMQLLAERASFLTAASGVAIATLERDLMLYCTALGNNVPEPGTVLDPLDKAKQACLTKMAASRVSDGGIFKLLVPVSQEQQAIGLFELSSQHEFLDADIQAIARLADLACIAIEHRDAAERAEAREWAHPQEGLRPMTWHAPEEKSSQTPRAVANKSEVATPDVHACAACGFPVSPGRKLCVECEQKPGTAPTELFSDQKQESWISEHGYTIATVLVTVLAILVVIWLRHGF